MSEDGTQTWQQKWTAALSTSYERQGNYAVQPQSPSQAGWLGSGIAAALGYAKAWGMRGTSE